MPAWPCSRCSSPCALQSAPRSWASPQCATPTPNRPSHAATSPWPSVSSPRRTHPPRHRRRLRHRQDHPRPSSGPRLPGPAPGAVILRSDVFRKALFGRSPTDRLPPEAYAPDVSTRVFATIAEPRRHLPRRGPRGDRRRRLWRTRATRRNRGGCTRSRGPVRRRLVGGAVRDFSSTASLNAARATRRMPTPPWSAVKRRASTPPASPGAAPPPTARSRRSRPRC